MTTERRSAGPRLATVWFGLLGGHVAWTVQLLANAAIVGLACSGDPERARLDGVNVFTAAMVVNNALMTAVAGTALVVALLALRAARRSEAGPLGGWRGALAAVGALLNATFLVVILMGASSHLALPLCASGAGG